MANKLRVGIGYDVHPLTPGRKLVVGGVEIPFDKGLSGWSDADVLTHAIIDALLGAAALGDIGSHFPPGEPQYKDIFSLALLEKVKQELANNGWEINNIDAIVIAEQPKLRDSIDKMRLILCQTLTIDMSQVNIKATTSERLGFIGRGEAIAAQAIAMLKGFNSNESI